jgi:exonuclease VII large subunit
MSLEQDRLLLLNKIRRQFEYKQSNLMLLKERLSGRSPLKRLEEGYAYVSVGGKTLTSVRDLSVDDEISVYLKDGKLITIIRDIEVM